jgi:hypothetical protein
VHLIVIHDQGDEYEEMVGEAGADFAVSRGKGAPGVVAAIRKVFL